MLSFILRKVLAFMRQPMGRMVMEPAQCYVCSQSYLIRQHFWVNGHCLHLTMTALPIGDFGRVLATENDLYGDYVSLSRTQRLDKGYSGKCLGRIPWAYDVHGSRCMPG